MAKNNLGMVAGASGIIAGLHYAAHYFIDSPNETLILTVIVFALVFVYGWMKK